MGSLIKYCFYVVCLLIVCQGCALWIAPKWVKDGVSNCYAKSSDLTNRDLKTNGFYYNPKGFACGYDSTCYNCFIFIEGGFVYDAILFSWNNSNYPKELLDTNLIPGTSGIYYTRSDTVFMSFVSRPGMNWSYYNTIYKLDDKYRLYNVDKSDQYPIIDTTFWIYHDLPYTFNSNISWLKKRRWAWCDKKEYRAWKKERRKNKGK